MFKQIFRVAFVTLVWKQYKHIIVSTLVLFAFLYLVGNVHADFLRHAELQDQKEGLGLSFIYKWLGFLFGVVAYFTYHYFRTRVTGTDKTDKASKKKVANAKAALNNEADDGDDPFARIRSRKKLRSRADFLIESDSDD